MLHTNATGFHVNAHRIEQYLQAESPVRRSQDELKNITNKYTVKPTPPIIAAIAPPDIPLSFASTRLTSINAIVSVRSARCKVKLSEPIETMIPSSDSRLFNTTRTLSRLKFADRCLDLFEELPVNRFDLNRLL